jgi:hypothetical protein
VSLLQKASVTKCSRNDERPGSHKRRLIREAREALDRRDMLGRGESRSAGRIDIELGIAAVGRDLDEVRDLIGRGVEMPLQHVRNISSSLARSLTNCGWSPSAARTCLAI